MSYVNRNSYGCRTPDIRDYGSEPLIVNIDCFTKQNPYYRTALWTGKHLQVTLMSIPVHGDIGLEIHSDVDQFIRIEDGCAFVMMGKNKTLLNYQQRVNSNYAVIIPAGTWHRRNIHLVRFMKRKRQQKTPKNIDYFNKRKALNFISYEVRGFSYYVLTCIL